MTLQFPADVMINKPAIPMVPGSAMRKENHLQSTEAGSDPGYIRTKKKWSSPTTPGLPNVFVCLFVRFLLPQWSSMRLMGHDRTHRYSLIQRQLSYSCKGWSSFCLTV